MDNQASVGSTNSKSRSTTCCSWDRHTATGASMIGVPSGATDPKDSMFAAIGQFSAVSIISPKVSCVTTMSKE